MLVEFKKHLLTIGELPPNTIVKVDGYYPIIVPANINNYFSFLDDKGQISGDPNRFCNSPIFNMTDYVILGVLSIEL